MEILLAFFIFVTIVVDTLSISLKSVPLRIRFASVYLISQSLSYLTRFSLFFILPIIGLVLDGYINISIKNFFLVFGVFILIHALANFILFDAMIKKYKILIYTFNISLKFFFITLLFLYSGLNKKLFNYSLRLDFKFYLMYFIAHLFLSLIFPLLLLLGSTFNDVRASLMGVISIYTGLFSIYIVFVVERKILLINLESRAFFVKSLVFSKSLSLLFSSGVLIFFALICM